MDIFLNYGMAWLSVLLLIILVLKYVARKMLMRNVQIQIWRKINSSMRNTHIYIGILLIITGFIHGLYSSYDIISLNFGTITFVLSILLGINYMVRKKIKPWLKYHQILTFLIVIILVIHIVEVGGIQVFNVLSNTNITNTNQDNTSTTDSSSNNNTSSSNENNLGTNVVLNDGTYEGSSMGYKSYITVSTTVKGNRIKAIDILEIGDDYQFYSRAVAQIPQSIIDEQSLEVDTVSRATFSSIGIINAVNDSLQNALKSGTLSEQMSLPTNRH